MGNESRGINTVERNGFSDKENLSIFVVIGKLGFMCWTTEEYQEIIEGGID